MKGIWPGVPAGLGGAEVDQWMVGLIAGRPQVRLQIVQERLSGFPDAERGGGR